MCYNLLDIILGEYVMAKRVKIIVAEEDKEKDNVTYKKNVVISIVSLATQEINGVASISRKSVSVIRSALSKNINRKEHDN